MSPSRSTPAVLLAGLFLALAGRSVAAEPGHVTLLKTPDGGIQPQVVVDGRGVLHLLYFKGNPAGGDLFYVRRGPGEERFSAPLRVNSQSGSAIAVGTIRGGQLAVGKGGRVHVAWNGSGRALPKGPGVGVPMLYTRLDDAGTAFEPQRNLMTATEALDGGGTVAADPQGNVCVAWHGRPIGGEKGEAHRQVRIVCSSDEGKTFAAEKPAWAKPTGACACCGMKAAAGRAGAVYLLYRGAESKIHRGTYLLAAKEPGAEFRSLLVHPWDLDACPMCSEAFAEGPDRVVAAWETRGQVYHAGIRPDTLETSAPEAVPGPGGNRKHPTVAVNTRGETLLAWAEGTGWQRGGALAWQVFDRSGKPTTVKGRVAGGVPVWSLPAAAALPDGRFLLVH